MWTITAESRVITAILVLMKMIVSQSTVKSKWQYKSKINQHPYGTEAMGKMKEKPFLSNTGAGELN